MLSLVLLPYLCEGLQLKSHMSGSESCFKFTRESVLQQDKRKRWPFLARSCNTKYLGA